MDFGIWREMLNYYFRWPIANIPLFSKVQTNLFFFKFPNKNKPARSKIQCFFICFQNKQRQKRISEIVKGEKLV
jgi:hypothetical protein